MIPFKLAGNIYYVGTVPQSSHLIDTGDGLILIDVGDEENAAVVINSIAELGFDVADVKYILLSHGHYDHSHGVPLIKQHCSATVMLAKEDVCYLENKFTPDAYYEDGAYVELGNTRILTVATPGHTLGTYSFFFDVTVDGTVMRAGMFGGAGVNQMAKGYLDKKGGLFYHQRGDFFRSLAKLREYKVDIFLGNHAWNNKTPEKYERSLTEKENPFINSNGEWQRFLNIKEKELKSLILKEAKALFVNYAHRGASSYAPENTMMAFNLGIYLGANGIETDVRRTLDGVAVLFHDGTLSRLADLDKKVEELTYEELLTLRLKSGELYDRIVTLDEFLRAFGWRDLTFAIELKGEGCERIVADAVRKYGISSKCVITSFKMEFLEKIHSYDGLLKLGFLTERTDDGLIEELKARGIDEYCPRADLITRELVEKWHYEGFRVRAWGVKDEELMRAAYLSGVDGMTLNFPDKLKSLL